MGTTSKSTKLILQLYYFLTLAGWTPGILNSVDSKRVDETSWQMNTMDINALTTQTNGPAMFGVAIFERNYYNLKLRIVDSG